MVDIVNITATGNIGQEVDLESLYTDLDFAQKEYNPETLPALQLRSEHDGPVIMLYSSGVYNIMGPKTKKEIDKLHTILISSIKDLGIHTSNQSEPEVRNMVCKADLDREIDLSALVVALGMEQVEYEPEQSPFVYYWPDDLNCLITIPANGQVIITGVKNRQSAKQALDHLQNRITNIFPE